MSSLVLVLCGVVVAVWPGSAGATRLSALAPTASPVSVTSALDRLVGRLVDRLRCRRSVTVDPRAARIVDLCAACLESGLPTTAALDAVAAAMGETEQEAGEVLRRVASRLRLGAPPADAFDGADLHPAVAPLAEVLARGDGAHSGPALEHEAERLRSAATAAALARAERAGVMVAGPLGLCFLPAFVCLGVVPVVVGFAGDVLPAVRP